MKREGNSAIWNVVPLLTLAGVIVSAVGAILQHREALIVGLLIVFCTLVVIWFYDEDRIRLRLRERELPFRLAQQRDFSCLVGLAHVLRTGTRHVRAEARDTLVRLLPNVQKSHAQHFPAEVQIELLGLAFDSVQPDNELAHALLAALRMVGHPEALGDLEFVRAHWRHLPVDERLLEEVAQCCEILRTRAERLEQKSHLLRAASPDLNSTLLHPAQRLPDDDDQVLLRQAEDSAR